MAGPQAGLRCPSKRKPTRNSPAARKYRHRPPSGGTRLEQADDAEKSERAEEERLQNVALRRESRRLDHKRLHRNHPRAILRRSVQGSHPTPLLMLARHGILTSTITLLFYRHMG